MSNLQPDECDSCHYETMALKSYEYGAPAEVQWLCELCAGTASGNACNYPEQYGENVAVLQTICYVGNVILSAIAKLDRR